MNDVSARWLVGVYAVLVALGDVVVVLPGGPSFGPDSGFVVAAVIDTLIVWRLWHGSVVAWFFGLFFALLALPLFLMSADAGSLLMVVLSCTQIIVLVTPRILRFVWSRHAGSVAPY